MEQDTLLENITKLESQVPQLIQLREDLVNRLRTGNFTHEEQAHLEHQLSEVNEVLAEIPFMRRELARARGFNAFFKGLGIALLGAIASGLAYVITSGAGVYVVFWGAIVFGIIRAVLGLIQFMLNR